MSKPDKLDKELVQIFGKQTPKDIADDVMCRFGVKISRREQLSKIIVFAIKKWDSLEAFEREPTND
jgi:hypothetical protein